MGESPTIRNSPFPHLAFCPLSFLHIMGFAKILSLALLLFVGHTLVNGSAPKVRSILKVDIAQPLMHAVYVSCMHL